MTVESMSEFEAAWVREHAWTNAHRRTHQFTPRFYSTCACQQGMTGHCANGDHSQCHSSKPFPHCETYVCDAKDQVLFLPKPFRHTTLTAGGTHRARERAAMVWLADRVCAWACPCDCHMVGKQMQLDLFAGRR